MGKLLHIVNGDSTFEALSRSSLIGDIIVWREMLCEGPLVFDVGSDDFWMSRYAFFESELGISKLKYFDTTIKEIIKIENISNYSDVVMWFEYDLFCQINLIALCSYLLKHYRKDINYFLVCVGIEKGSDRLHSLADYSAEKYPDLMNRKTKLSRKDFLFAEHCWRSFVTKNEEELRKFDFDTNAKFGFLQDAIDQHIKRFPGKNGLNQIENKILELISFETHTKNDLIRKILQWQQKETVYGFGDLQYYLIMKNLKDFIEVKEEVYFLSEKGKNLV